MIRYKDQIQKLLQQRDEAYEAYAQKTEDIFFKQFVSGGAFAPWCPTRAEFNLSDVVCGMSVTNALEIGKSQKWSPTKLARELYVLCLLAEKEPV